MNNHKTTEITAPFTLKSIGGEGCFQGYASVFDELDQQGDRVLKGAFQESLKTWQAKRCLPKMLWQHDQTKPLGVWTKIKEDQKGLYVEGQLLLDVQKSREAYAMIKANILDGLSIGCQVIEAEPGENPGERLLCHVDLFEVSLVTFAANPKATITQVKNNDPQRDLFQSLKRTLDILKF